MAGFPIFGLISFRAYAALGMGLVVRRHAETPIKEFGPELATLQGTTLKTIQAAPHLYRLRFFLSPKPHEPYLGCGARLSFRTPFG